MNKGLLTKILAITGTILTSFPYLFIIITSASRFSRGGIWHFDYLLPAEFFPVVLIGGLLLVWAAFRAHIRLGLISWVLGIAVAALIISQLVAIVSGMASGETEAAGLVWIIALSLIILYSVLAAGLCIAGIFLVRDLYRSRGAAQAV